MTLVLPMVNRRPPVGRLVSLPVGFLEPMASCLTLVGLEKL